MSEIYFLVDQVRTFDPLNSDISPPGISMALKNVANYVKKSYFSSYRQSTIIKNYKHN